MLARVRWNFHKQHSPAPTQTQPTLERTRSKLRRFEAEAAATNFTCVYFCSNEHDAAELAYRTG